MKRNKNTKRYIVAIITCISVAAPIVCLPVGTQDRSSARLTVRKAYAATFPESQEKKPEVESVQITPLDGFENIDISNGGTVSATYLDGYEPSAVEESTESYNDIAAYMVYQDYDEAELPIELLDPQYFAPDETTYYIKASSSILKETPVMDSTTLSTLDYGEEVTRIAIGDTWSKIRTDEGLEGFVLTSTLSFEMVWTDIYRHVWVDTDSLTLRASASTQSEVVATLYDEQHLICDSTADKWYHVTTDSGLQGYVYKSYTTETPPPTPTFTPTPIPRNNNSGGGGSSSGGGGGSYTGTTGNTSSLPTITGCNGESIVSICESMLGKPYVWGACSADAVDCSGLVCYAYGLLGIPLPHYSVDLCSCGVEVSRNDVQPGDVVCWSNGSGYCHHVGIYVGGGQVIHAAGVRWGVIYGSIDMHPIVTIRRIIQ